MKQTFRDGPFGASVSFKRSRERPVKRLVLLFAILTLAACGADKSTAVQTGTVSFRVDNLTCVGTSSINFYIDGALVGTETLSAGQSSSPFRVRAGPHTAGAQEATPSGYTWPNQNINVPVDANYTALLAC